jgi:hypothetical protein
MVYVPDFAKVKIRETCSPGLRSSFTPGQDQVIFPLVEFHLAQDGDCYFLKRFRDSQVIFSIPPPEFDSDRTPRFHFYRLVRFTAQVARGQC